MQRVPTLFRTRDALRKAAGLGRTGPRASALRLICPRASALPLICPRASALRLICPRASALRLIWDLPFEILDFDGPIVVLVEFAFLIEKHFRGFIVTFQVPIEPGECDGGVFAPVRLAVGSPVAYIHVRHDHWNVIDAR